MNHTGLPCHTLQVALGRPLSINSRSTSHIARNGGDCPSEYAVTWSLPFGLSSPVLDSRDLFIFDPPLNQRTLAFYAACLAAVGLNPRQATDGGGTQGDASPLFFGRDHGAHFFRRMTYRRWKSLLLNFAGRSASMDNGRQSRNSPFFNS